MALAHDDRRTGFRVTGRFVLLTLLAFFGVTMAVNALFVTMALRSFSGEVAPRAYVQGLKFNDQIGERAREAALGWRMGLGLDTRPAGRVAVAVLRDRAGAPLTGATVVGRLGRPAQDAYDQRLTFRMVAPGLYEAPVGALAPGAWDVEATAHADQATLAGARRVVLR